MVSNLPTATDYKSSYYDNAGLQIQPNEGTFFVYTRGGKNFSVYNFNLEVKEVKEVTGSYGRKGVEEVKRS